MNNYAPNDKTVRGRTIPSVKIDQYVSAKSKVSFHWGEWIQNMNKNIGDGLPYPITNARVYEDRNHTFRLTLDQTVTPTFLVHVGLGEMHHNHRGSAPLSSFSYDSVGQLGLKGNATGFPQITGLTASQGGFLFVNSSGGTTSTIGPTNAGIYYNDKPTAVASATWVRGNHTFKTGIEWRRDIWTDVETVGTSGIYNVSAIETGLPYLQATTTGGGSVGFPYASFLLGAIDTASVRNPQDPQLRKASWGLYLQDTWKVTRKLTLDYGLRWNYQTALHEMYYRTAMFAPSVANPSAGGLLGATTYVGYGPGRCNCSFTGTYKLALGPRIGVAYQLTPKTVVRAGWGLIYGTTAMTNYITGTAIVGTGWNVFNFSNGNYGTPSVTLQNGLQFSPAALNAASYDPGIRPQAAQIDSPPYYLDRSGGRPPRMNQWNISLQRQITPNLLVEASFVGNTGVWLRGDAMNNINALTRQRIASFGLNINNSADYTLLTSPWNSAAVQARGFKAPYTGYPTGLTLAQTLRPFPQFGNITSDWAALGNSWYDALQTKVTKRYSHGLDVTAAFTWSKELSLGATSGTAGGAPVNDVMNRQQNKYIASDSQPVVLSIGFTYRLPGIGSNRVLRNVIRDWSLGGTVRYASGLPIQSPAAQNNLTTALFRRIFANRVPGQPLFLQDLNCHCIDPNEQFVLNPAAWSDPAKGQWGTAAAYYNDYRYQRRPSEQMSLGRVFSIREHMSVRIRAEFYNIFNRTEMNNPDSTNALATQSSGVNGVVSGFARINTGSLAAGPRQGQIVARFQF